MRNLDDLRAFWSNRSAPHWPPEPGEVHVWVFELDVDEHTLARLSSSLDEAEQARAERLLTAELGRRIRAGRGWLREVLSRYLECGPRDLRFVTGPNGKPALADEATHDLRFNLSHSHNRMVLAVSWGRAVGVDVERVRPQVECAALAKRFFSPREREELARLAAEEQRDAFFQIWTRKEAYLKATGRGLTLPLDSFDVSVGPDAPAQLLACRTDPEAVRCWAMTDLTVDPGYAGALVYEGRLLSLREWWVGWDYRRP